MKANLKGKKDEIASGMPVFFSIAAILLIAGFAAGYLFPSHFRTALTPSINQIAEIAKKTQAVHSGLYTIWVLFSHNVLAALMCITMGFLFGALSALQIWGNGVVAGFFTGVQAYQLHIASWRIFTFGILPHGIFELTAFVWAAALGIANGFSVLHTLQLLFMKRASASEEMRTASDPVRHAIRRSIRALPYIVGLLLFAAIIEATVTPLLLHWGIHSI